MMALFRAAALLLSAGTALGAVQHGAVPPLPTHRRPHNRALPALMQDRFYPPGAAAEPPPAPAGAASRPPPPAPMLVLPPPPPLLMLLPPLLLLPGSGHWQSLPLCALPLRLRLPPLFVLRRTSDAAHTSSQHAAVPCWLPKLYPLPPAGPPCWCRCWWRWCRCAAPVDAAAAAVARL